MRTAPALLAALFLALLLAPAASALIVAHPSRFDLGDLAPGAAFEGVVNVTNKGDAPTRVEIAVTVLEGEQVAAEPAALSLAPGETRPVSIRLDLPANASGGRHDPRLELVEAGEDEGATVGRAAVSVPLVFRVQNLKVGNLEARHPVAGEDTEARILVQNFLGEAARADVTLRVLDAQGAEVARAAGPTPTIPANGSASLALALPTAPLPPGAYVLRGEAARGAHGSNAWETPLFVGERRLDVRDAAVRVEPGGRVVFTARVSNEGTIPLPGVVTFAFGAAGAPSRSVAAESGPLPPGESRVLSANLTVAPGAYVARALVHWPGGEAASNEMRFTVEGAARARDERTPVPVLLLVAGAAVASLLRRRA